MDNYLVYYSGACFENGGSRELAEKKVHDRVANMGKVFRIEAMLLRSDEKEYSNGNYVVSFEGEIMVRAESKELAENQAYDRLSQLGQVTVMAFKE